MTPRTRALARWLALISMSWSGSAVAGQIDHSQHQSPPAPPSSAAAAPPAEGPALPPITDADRAAAFPDVQGHTVHDDVVHTFVLFDQLEWRAGDGGAGWDTKGWIGWDRDRFWFRTEGHGGDGGVDRAEAHLLYGRAIGRWWEVVAGVRQDIRPDLARTWAAVGLQGLAPYWFEVEATAYVGESGRTQVRLESEYELLVTNRLILQPRIEMHLYGKADPQYGFGAGLGSADVGLRLRYEIRRELAPYVGVTWSRTFFQTADLARAAGRNVNDARLAAGVRLWF